MWMQAQNLVPAGSLDWNGALLILGLVLVAALGVLAETGRSPRCSTG